MESKEKNLCENFVMSSFSRTYGVNKIKTEEKFRSISSCWCENNKVDKNISLEEYDRYFEILYEEW